MAVKGFLFLCASALFVQSVVSQCMGRFGPYRHGMVADELAFDGLGYASAWPGRHGCGLAAPAIDLTIASSLNAAHGGSLPVTSSSCAAPTGLAVASDNVYEGPVAVAGNLPFLGTAAVEGEFPTAGVSAISYGCGDGAVAITAEGPVEADYAGIGIVPAAIAPAAIAPAAIVPAAIASPVSPWGYKGLPARGCGCSGPYLY